MFTMAISVSPTAGYRLSIVTSVIRTVTALVVAVLVPVTGLTPVTITCRFLPMSAAATV
ncbi:hypothetical protein D3C84_960400 [compost metagenome]